MSSFKLKRRSGTEDPVRGTTERSRRAVIGYVIALAVAVIILILLSYFIHQRDSSILDTLHEQSAAAQQSIVKLQAENQRLIEDNQRITDEKKGLETQVAELTADGDALRQEISALEDALDEASKKYDVDTKNLRSEYDALLKKYNELNENTENTGNTENTENN